MISIIVTLETSRTKNTIKATWKFLIYTFIITVPPLWLLGKVVHNCLLIVLFCSHRSEIYSVSIQC